MKEEECHIGVFITAHLEKRTGRLNHFFYTACFLQKYNTDKDKKDKHTKIGNLRK